MSYTKSIATRCSRGPDIMNFVMQQHRRREERTVPPWCFPWPDDLAASKADLASTRAKIRRIEESALKKREYRSPEGPDRT